MDELLRIGGARFFVPAVLAAATLYAIRGVFGLHGRRSQRRKDFLELWRDAPKMDDLWLEVAVRHLFGALLPAPVIRVAMAQPDQAQSLQDIATLWPLMKIDSGTGDLKWDNGWYQRLVPLNLRPHGWFGAYVVLVLAAMACGYIAYNAEATSPFAWIYGTAAIGCLVAAFSSLLKRDATALAAARGELWLALLNRKCSLVRR